MQEHATLSFYICLFLHLPVFPFFPFILSQSKFYFVCKLTFLCLSQLLHWMLLCLSILHVVCLLVSIGLHSFPFSSFKHLPASMRSFILQLFAYFLYSPSFTMFSSLFSVTYTGLCSLSKQNTLEATDVSFFVHKPFQLFQLLFLFVSAAAVTSDLLQAGRGKPTVCVQS